MVDYKKFLYLYFSVCYLCYANARLDQGLSEIPSCPTCRKPLFASRPRGEGNSPSVDVSSDEQLARQLSSGFDGQNTSGRIPTGVLPNQTHNPLENNAWRFSSLLETSVIYHGCI